MSAARVVVACRLPGALGFGDRAAAALARMQHVVEQAAELGGIPVASSYDSLAFAWDEDAIQEAMSLATRMTTATGDAQVWACGVACGQVETGTISAAGAPPLYWGAALATASALARVAKPREVLVDPALPAAASHELLTNRARAGRVGGKLVRGLRVDSRQAWRGLAAADVARMVDPPLVGREAELARIMAVSDVIILRADSGFGGSRLLAEVAAKTRPSRSLMLTPFAVVHEPLGALRRAMAFVAATERITLPPHLHPVLDQLLGAQGVTVENAALLLAHQLQRRPGMPLPSILLDDATDLDEPSVDACARAIELLGSEVRVVARIDSMSQLPRSLARFSDGEEVTLGRLESELAQELAGLCTGDALERHARIQWARRGGGTPLGVVEAVAAGVVRGELLWSKDSLGRLSRTSGEDVARPVGYWIARRAEGLRESSRDVLIALAHLGGEASAQELIDVVAAVAPEVDLRAEIVVLRRGRWLRESRPGTFTLATRAQREAILEFSRNMHPRDWRIAVGKVLERAPGTMRRAEAAQHAARAGMGEWASRLAMAAARTAAQAGLEEPASTLAAFAGAQDPGSADLDLGELPIEEVLDDVDVIAEDPEPSIAVSAPGPTQRAQFTGPRASDDSAASSKPEHTIAFEPGAVSSKPERTIAFEKGAFEPAAVSSKSEHTLAFEPGAFEAEPVSSKPEHTLAFDPGAVERGAVPERKHVAEAPRKVASIPKASRMVDRPEGATPHAPVKVASIGKPRAVEPPEPPSVGEGTLAYDGPRVASIGGGNHAAQHSDDPPSVGEGTLAYEAPKAVALHKVIPPYEPEEAPSAPEATLAYEFAALEDAGSADHAPAGGSAPVRPAGGRPPEAGQGLRATLVSETGDEDDDNDSTLVAGATQLEAVDALRLELDEESVAGNVASPVPTDDVAPLRPPKPVDYHELLEAARDLRETRWAEVARKSLVQGSIPAAQRRGLLALARAYANEGRGGEALILGLDALARMKEATDVHGTRTCLLFLARLYEQTERSREAVTLKSAAQATA